MELAEWQTRDWKRGQRWADACTRGDCAYARADPGSYLGDGCPGYHVTLYWEETRPVLRYCECVRRKTWHENRRTQRTAEMPAARRRPKFAGDDS